MPEGNTKRKGGKRGEEKDKGGGREKRERVSQIERGRDRSLSYYYTFLSSLEILFSTFGQKGLSQPRTHLYRNLSLTLFKMVVKSCLIISW